VVVLVAKFVDGAWITALLIILMIVVNAGGEPATMSA